MGLTESARMLHNELFVRGVFRRESGLSAKLFEKRSGLERRFFSSEVLNMLESLSSMGLKVNSSSCALNRPHGLWSLEEGYDGKLSFKSGRLSFKSSISLDADRQNIKSVIEKHLGYTPRSSETKIPHFGSIFLPDYDQTLNDLLSFYDSKSPPWPELKKELRRTHGVYPSQVFTSSPELTRWLKTSLVDELADLVKEIDWRHPEFSEHDLRIQALKNYLERPGVKNELRSCQVNTLDLIHLLYLIPISSSRSKGMMTQIVGFCPSSIPLHDELDALLSDFDAHQSLVKLRRQLLDTHGRYVSRVFAGPTSQEQWLKREVLGNITQHRDTDRMVHVDHSDEYSKIKALRHYVHLYHDVLKSRGVNALDLLHVYALIPPYTSRFSSRGGCRSSSRFHTNMRYARTSCLPKVLDLPSDLRVSALRREYGFTKEELGMLFEDTRHYLGGILDRDGYLLMPAEDFRSKYGHILGSIEKIDSDFVVCLKRYLTQMV